MVKMSLELNFIAEFKGVKELRAYARRNKIRGFSRLNKGQLIDLVNSNKRERAKSMLTEDQRIILIVDLYTIMYKSRNPIFLQLVYPLF